MSDLLSAPRGELLKLVYDLIEENQGLKIQIVELQERIKQLREKLKEKEGKGNNSPLLVKPSVKKKVRKAKRKAREKGYGRSLDIPTQKVFHAYETCPDCGGPLGKPSVTYARQVIDIPLPVEATVTEHVVCKRWCYCCQKRVAPKINLKQVVLGQHRLGINLMTIIVTLRERFRLPLGVIQVYLKTFHDLRLSEGEIVEILHKIAGLSKEKYKEIHQQVLSFPAICADETGHREDGINGYLWNFATPQYQYLLYRQSRGSKVVREVLGEDGQDFDGVLVSDFLGSYNEHAGFHQRCWAHLLKDIRELRKQYPSHPPLNKWAKRIREIYQQARDYSGPDPTLPLGLQAQERIKKEQECKQALVHICNPYLTKDSPMSPLSGRMIKFLSELFSFVRFPDVPSTNNLSERTLRHFVVQRKIFGGTRSEKGSQTKAILGSLFGTWNLQGLNPLQELRLHLARAPCQ